MTTEEMSGAIETCGCLAPPRRRCDLCDGQRHHFVACSLRCLDAHLAAAHGDEGRRPCLERTKATLRASNAPHEGNWAEFEPHRARLMSLLAGARGEGGICVLGAGNCDDLDLSELVRGFGDVHLVDLDGSALRRAVARVAEAERERIVVHEGVDLTGLLGTIETWGESDPALTVVARRAAEAVARGIGRTFRVVLSSCIASQLCVPFYRTLAREPAEWASLMEIVGRIHLRTIALLTRPGGIGVVLGDSLYASRGSADVAVPTWDSLDPVAEDRLRNGPILLRNPQFLLTLVHEPSLASLFERPDITQPWLWTVEDGVMLVYAISMRRRAGAPELDPELTEIHVRSNRDTENHWDLYADHRDRVTSIVTSRGAAGSLCILGAGNANALDLDRLGERFAHLHLADVDAAALARAVERQSPDTRAKLVPHANVDLSGLLRVLPAWRTRAPGSVELASLGESAPAAIAASLPGPFDVVLSDCLLTQIYWTCFKALGAGPALNEVVKTALTIHLGTLAALTRGGGTALLVTDVVTSESVPLAELVAARDPLELLYALASDGALFSGTDPALVTDALERAGLHGTFASPELLPPWVWNVGKKRIALVYAMVLARR
jgi:hypothetical protein